MNRCEWVDFGPPKECQEVEEKEAKVPPEEERCPPPRPVQAPPCPAPPEPPPSPITSEEEGEVPRACVANNDVNEDKMA